MFICPVYGCYLVLSVKMAKRTFIVHFTLHFSVITNATYSTPIIVDVYAEDSNPGLNSTYLSSVLVVNINFHIQTITAHIRRELFFIFNRLNTRKNHH